MTSSPEVPASTSARFVPVIVQRSSASPTVAVEVDVLSAGSGSTDDVATAAAFAMDVPSGTPETTPTTRVNASLAPEASEGFEHDTVPAAPTAGIVQVQPTGDVSDTNAVLGRRIVRTTLAAASGPPFATMMRR